MPGTRLVVACWGELVWDVFDDQSAAMNARKVLGGSATAIAAQLAAHAAEARLVSAIGEDPDGERALEVLQHRGVNVSGVLRSRTSPTAALRVRILAQGEPEYSPYRRLDWASMDFDVALAHAAAGADALVFSAFAQGACLDLGSLERAVACARPRLVGCDLNLRRAVPVQFLARVAANADFVKLNQLEYERAAQALSGEEPAAWLLRSGRTQLVAVTSGAHGARLVTQSEVVQAGSAPPRLLDTVGAGDAFSAALTLALLADLPPKEALARATAAAEAQLGLLGAMPEPNRNEEASG